VFLAVGVSTQPQNIPTKREYRDVHVLMVWAASEITGGHVGR
jgi:hypothetical protein